jgi:uncharacterized MnhB-related membrane protein
MATFPMITAYNPVHDLVVWTVLSLVVCWTVFPLFSPDVTTTSDQRH